MLAERKLKAGQKENGARQSARSSANTYIRMHVHGQWPEGLGPVAAVAAGVRHTSQFSDRSPKAGRRVVGNNVWWPQGAQLVENVTFGGVEDQIQVKRSRVSRLRITFFKTTFGVRKLRLRILKPCWHQLFSCEPCMKICPKHGMIVATAVTACFTVSKTTLV